MTISPEVLENVSSKFKSLKEVLATKEFEIFSGFKDLSQFFPLEEAISSKLKSYNFSEIDYCTSAAKFIAQTLGGNKVDEIKRDLDQTMKSMFGIFNETPQVKFGKKDYTILRLKNVVTNAENSPQEYLDEVTDFLADVVAKALVSRNKTVCLAIEELRCVLVAVAQEKIKDSAIGSEYSPVLEYVPLNKQGQGEESAELYGQYEGLYGPPVALSDPNYSAGYPSSDSSETDTAEAAGMEGSPLPSYYGVAANGLEDGLEGVSAAHSENELTYPYDADSSLYGSNDNSSLYGIFDGPPSLRSSYVPEEADPSAAATTLSQGKNTPPEVSAQYVEPRPPSKKANDYYKAKKEFFDLIKGDNALELVKKIYPKKRKEETEQEYIERTIKKASQIKISFAETCGMAEEFFDNFFTNNTNNLDQDELFSKITHKLAEVTQPLSPNTTNVIQYSDPAYNHIDALFKFRSALEDYRNFLQEEDPRALEHASAATLLPTPPPRGQGNQHT